MKNLAYESSSSNLVPEMSSPPLTVVPLDPVTDAAQASLREEINRFRSLVVESRNELLRLQALADEGETLVRLARNRELRFRADLSGSDSSSRPSQVVTTR